jgi:hypothetical protein
MTFQIERDVPLPVRGANLNFPFKDLSQGDSFVVRLSDVRCSKLSSLQQGLYSSARETIGASKITVRKLPEGDGFRVWRIAA